MDICVLKKIGLGDKEIKIYLNLLELGVVSVRSLSDQTNINRGTVYDILKKLQSLGLVSYFHKDTKQKFVAESPENLISIIKQKEEGLQKTKQGIEGLIPELKSIQGKDGRMPTTKYYEGSKGVRTILDDLLSSFDKSRENEYYIYSAKESSEDINSAYPDFTKKRINKKIKVKAISLAKGGGLSGLDERKWLGTNNETATFILIYKNKCAFVSRDFKGDPVGVIIDNKMIYETQKMIFLQLWNLLK